MLTRFQVFDQNHALTPLEKSQFCECLKPMLSLFRMVCLLYKMLTILFWDLFSRCMTWEYRGLQEVTKGYRELQGVTRGYRRLQGVTKGYRGLQGVTRGGRELQGVTGGYKTL